MTSVGEQISGQRYLDAAVPVLRGPQPRPSERSYAEYENYEQGHAEHRASRWGDDPATAWRRMRAESGPHHDAMLDYVLDSETFGPLVRGSVADIAAGSSWLAGKVSRLERVERVFAQDLSEGFLKRVGVPVFQAEGGDLSKLTLVVSDFNDMPLPDHSLDAAFMFAMLHHSLSPIRTVREVLRCLKPGGVLFIHEQPTALLRLEKQREWSLTVKEACEIPTTFNDFNFYLRTAGALDIRWYPVDFSRSALRGAIRKLMRATGIENWVRPPTYLCVARAPVAMMRPSGSAAEDQVADAQA